MAQLSCLSCPSARQPARHPSRRPALPSLWPGAWRLSRPERVPPDGTIKQPGLFRTAILVCVAARASALLVLCLLVVLRGTPVCRLCHLPMHHPSPLTLCGQLCRRRCGSQSSQRHSPPQDRLLRLGRGALPSTLHARTHSTTLGPPSPTRYSGTVFRQFRSQVPLCFLLRCPRSAARPALPALPAPLV